jgi:hypothetical protein
MWGKIKRAFAAFEIYTDAFFAAPLVVFGVLFVLWGGHGLVGPLFGLASAAYGMWATYKTLGRLGWIARG